MIKATSLSRYYGHFAAVDRVNFTIEPGQIVGLLGHNGAGKTTIMKMLTGFLEPSEGHIEINGKALLDHTTDCQQLIGYLPESPPIYPEMSVVDYLDYAARLRKIPNKDRREAVLAAIHKTDLLDKASALIRTLSRGYRQRVGVAQAILNKPKILILDEPTNGLDPSQIQHMRDLIQEMGKESTVILSTHILQEVNAICDRVIIVKHGKIALDSTLDGLTESKRLVLLTNKTYPELQPHFKTLDQLTHICSQKTENVFTHTLEVHNQSIHLAAADIAKTLVNAQVPIYGIQPENRDLETVFAEINQAPQSNSNSNQKTGATHAA